MCKNWREKFTVRKKTLSFTHSANKKQNGVSFLNRALSISPKASVACSNTSHTNTHKSHYYLASGRHLSLFFCYIDVTLLQTRTVRTSTAPKWSHRKTSHALTWSRQAVCPFLGFNSYTLSFNSSVKFQVCLQFTQFHAHNFSIYFKVRKCAINFPIHHRDGASYKLATKIILQLHVHKRLHAHSH